jgi:hypothetical protein
LENIGQARQQLPAYGIATDLISDAKHEIFRLESGLQRVRLDVVLHGPETNRRIEFRSEFPVLRCSASRDSVTFSKVFGQDGTMTVTADIAGGAVGSAGVTPVAHDASVKSENERRPGFVVSCLVDKSVRNPVPKPRSERQEHPDEARVRAEAKAKARAKAEVKVKVSQKVLDRFVPLVAVCGIALLISSMYFLCMATQLVAW